MGEVDLRHLKPTGGDMDVPAVLRSLSKTFENDKRFNKLTHGGGKIVTAVLEVVRQIFERENPMQDVADQLRTFLERRKSLK